MKRNLVNDLACPRCPARSASRTSGKLTAQGGGGGDEELVEGWLVCGGCGAAYQVNDGVARFTSRSGSARYEEDVFAQGYIQNHYQDKIAERLRGDPTLKAHDLTGFFSTGPGPTYYESLIEFLGSHLSPHSKVLDLGCSVGRLTTELSRRAQFVFGVDSSETHVRIAREICRTGRLDARLGVRRLSGAPPGGYPVGIDVPEAVRLNVEYLVADDETLPFPDGFFDVICCSAVIDRVPDLELFIQNIGRVARDGTVVLISSPFDWEPLTPREKQLGFGAFGTREGTSEDALEEFMKRRRYHLRDRRPDILWTTFHDRRHRRVWSVYAGLFEAWHVRTERLPGGEAREPLIPLYQQVYRESPVFRESWTEAEARRAVENLDYLVAARRTGTKEYVGFAGGWPWTEDNAGDNLPAYERLRSLVGSTPAFYIDELGVGQHYEGAGVASRLLEELLGRATADGFHAFALVTNIENQPALALYGRLGFTLLAGPGGTVHIPCVAQRVRGEKRTDWRTCLYRIDDHAVLTPSTDPPLRDGFEARLAFFQPQLRMNAAHRESEREAVREGLRPIARQVSVVHSKALWKSVEPTYWPESRIMERLPELQLVILAFDAQTREPVGYALFDRVGEARTLFLDSIGVSGGVKSGSRNWQSAGLGSAMLREALRRLPSRHVAVRTQNPAVIKLLRKLNPARVLPIDAAYQGTDRTLLEALRDRTAELRGTRIDLDTGVSRAAYVGKLGLFQVDGADLQVAGIERRLRELAPDWSQDSGDAVVVLAADLREA
jgi:SAM-dependent methyltransferase/uncharacterized protein YbaR (Trm112 family)